MMGAKKDDHNVLWISDVTKATTPTLVGENGTYLPVKISGKDYDVKDVTYPAGTTSKGMDYVPSYNDYDDYNNWGQQGTTNFTYKSSHHHWRQRVPLAGVSGTLLASGHQNTPKGKASEWGDPYPDLGVYLSNYWLEDLGGIATVGIPDLIKPLWPFVTITWPDYGTVNQVYYGRLIDVAVKYLRDGKTVEVACAAGHGRTGTLLAGIIATVENLDAKTTIDSLRTRYCKEAVESYGQESMIYTYLGEPLPANTYKTSSYMTGRECTCGHSDGMHGKNMNDPKDYKIGVCVQTGCDCSKFVLYVAATEKPRGKTGALKPCTCGHAKNKHRGYDKACVKCDSCTGYELAPEESKVIHIPTTGLKVSQIPLPEASTHPVVCSCGHLQSSHWARIGMFGCKLCMCEEFEDSDTIEDADFKAYSLPARWIKGENGMTHRDTGETWQELSTRIAAEELEKSGGVTTKAMTTTLVDRLMNEMGDD